MKTVIFVGDRPSPKMKPGARPFEGAACEKRLMEWVTAVIPEFARYDIINQCDYAWAELYAETLLRKVAYIALGVNASKALTGIPHLKLPHPSGLNRQINDKAYITKQLNFVKRTLRKLLK